jgi:poly-gamma-glutamate capsule biosynthesis protein CapA/YwtB (metallophosphatase superfamily)
MMRSLRKLPRSTAIKLGALALAILVMCLPLFFWPSGDDTAASTGKPETVITIPPVVSLPVASETTTTTEATGTTTTTEPVVKITIAATGDIIIHESVLQSAYNRPRDIYDFRAIFAPVAPYLAAADYTVVNLESRMAGGSMSGADSTRLNAPYSLTDALKLCGVDLAATANNHAADFGWLGIVRTLNRLDYAGIAHIGTYRSAKDKSTPFIVDIKGIKVAFLNYTAFVNAGMSVKGHEAYAINILDVDKVAGEAAAARAKGADVVVAMLHYGMEYIRTPTSDQIRVSQGSSDAKGLLSRGVDVILGSHPHVVEPIYKVLQYSRGLDTYVAYSLGNFLSGQRWRYSDSGIIAYVHIEKQGTKTRVTGLNYLPVYVQKSSEEGATYRILPVLPGLTPQTDTAITPAEETRMNQVWSDLENLLYRPDEGTVPLDPADLGLTDGAQ